MYTYTMRVSIRLPYNIRDMIYMNPGRGPMRLEFPDHGL